MGWTHTGDVKPVDNKGKETSDPAKAVGWVHSNPPNHRPKVKK